MVMKAESIARVDRIISSLLFSSVEYLKLKRHYRRSSQCCIGPNSARQYSTVAHRHTSSHCYRHSPLPRRLPPPLISSSQTSNHSLLILEHDPPLEHYPQLARGLGEKGTIVFSDVEYAILKNDRSLQEVFKLFDLIHIVTTDHKILIKITQEVVEDFAAENVVYLELRTTPKEPLKISTLLKEIIKVFSSYHHSSAITGFLYLVKILLFLSNQSW